MNSLTTKIIVHNQYSYNILSKEVSPELRGKIQIIKHGNYSLFINNLDSRESALRELNLDPSKQYILFFGQIKKVKGLDILLNALPHVREKVVLIVAGKPWKDNFLNYQKIIDDLGLHGRVKKFIRYIGNEEKDLFFHVCHAVIIPYTVIYQSGVLLMGMSYGLPIIASDLEPICEIIKPDENGVLFKTGDEISLANKINTLLQDNDLMNKLGSNALKTVRKDHSWDDIARKYLEIFN